MATKTPKEPLEMLTVRVPPSVLAQLPPPSLTGERAQFIREAIEEKLARQKHRKGPVVTSVKG